MLSYTKPNLISHWWIITLECQVNAMDTNNPFNHTVSLVSHDLPITEASVQYAKTPFCPRSIESNRWVGLQRESTITRTVRGIYGNVTSFNLLICIFLPDGIKWWNFTDTYRIYWKSYVCCKSAIVVCDGHACWRKLCRNDTGSRPLVYVDGIRSYKSMDIC